MRTKLDEDRRPLPTKSISIAVRCYEARVSRSRGTVHTTLLVDYTTVLWSKPTSADWADVGDMELPFKFTLPKNTTGPSTANFQVYRTFWRVEASKCCHPSVMTASHLPVPALVVMSRSNFNIIVIEHIPITGVGHRLLRYFDLPLIRYDVSSYPLSNPPVSPASPYLQTTKPRAPVVRYNVSTPDHPVGPNDIIFASVTIQPLDPAVSVRSATVAVERRIDLRRSPATSSPPSTPTIDPYQHADDVPTPSSSTSNLSPAPHDPEGSTHGVASSSQLTLDSMSGRPLLTSPSLTPSSSNSAPYSNDGSARTITSTVLSHEYTDLARDSMGTFQKTATLQWPASRPHSRWALGETMHTSRASVRFFLRVSIRVVGPAGSDALELEPREIAVAATSEAERRLALTKWAEASGGRSKSKSPWRSRHDPDEERIQAELAVQGHSKTYPGAVPDVRNHGQHHVHKEKNVSRGTKRPHTSAGPRDKSNFDTFDVRDAPSTAHIGTTASAEHRVVRPHGHELKSSRGYTSLKPETGLGESVLVLPAKEQRTARTKERNTLPQPEHIRAWEEELVRIEAKSRRNSSMLNFWGFGRKKEIVQRG